MRIVVDNEVFFDIRCRWRYKRVMANQRKNNGPMLVDQFFAELGGAKTQKLLDRLDRLIPWDQLARPIDSLYRNDAGRGGRPNVPVVMMLKCILLQKWFNLSDPGLEEAIDDRISFRRFVSYLRVKLSAKWSRNSELRQQNPPPHGKGVERENSLVGFGTKEHCSL